MKLVVALVPFDGLSIAQAVVEHICKHIHGKTLFATHYHELISLEESYSKLKNYTVAVKEKVRMLHSCAASSEVVQTVAMVFMLLDWQAYRTLY